VFQWTWLEQAIERNIIPKRSDQFNSIHECLIEAWKKLGGGRHLHLAGMTESTEDSGTLSYLEDTASQAGLATTLIDIEQIGLREDGQFVDLDDREIELAFKLYPWEWMFRDAFGAKLARASTRWIEPPWKAILSNKGILPLLWEMFPNHPNLLPAYFEDDPEAVRIGTSFVRKPLIRAKAPTSPWSAPAPRWSSSRDLTARRVLSGRRWRRCRILPTPIRCWEAAGRPHPMRPVDPRGRESDHRQYLTVFAARDPVSFRSKTRWLSAPPKRPLSKCAA